MQGGERKYVGEGASGKTEDEAKVVGKVFTTNIPTTKPIMSKADLVVSTGTTTRKILKGIVIGTTGEGSASKPKETPRNQDMGKKVIIEISKEERKADIEAEMEKQRQIQSILRHRQSDPPHLNKGDPKKLHSYENIEARVAYNEMHEFVKKPMNSYAIEKS